MRKAQLIAEIYEVVLKPERYDHFMALWEEHISGAIDEFTPLQTGDFPVGKSVNDPELEAHFQRAYLILEKLGREAKEITTPREYTDQKSEPAFFVTIGGQIVDENEAARQMLGDISRLDELHQLIDGWDCRKLHTMQLGLDRPDLAEQIHVFQFRTSQNRVAGNSHEQLFLAKPMRFSHNQPVLLGIYAIGVDWNEGLEALLSDAFALTTSELQVGKGLCAGKSLGEIARERGRSVHTLRAQVKSMLRKTATGSQADLVRIMVTLASFGQGQGSGSANDQKRLETGTQILVQVEGNRNMPVHQIGPVDGRPVLFLHGMLDGIAICRSVASLLKRRNIKLIAPVRPSFSNSPPAYRIETAPEEFADDLRHILDHLEIATVPVIGHMAGSVYAFAAAAALPDRISGILNISGGVPIRSMRQLSSMSARQRVVAWTARFAPALLPAILRTGISQIDRGNETDFMNALYAKGSCDRNVVADLDVRAAIHAGYQFAIAQGHRAFEVDSRHVTRDWSTYLEHVQQRTILAHGVFDPTVTIGSVRKFAGRHANIELEEHDDAGQLLFYQKPKEIISTLCKLMQD